VGNEGGDQVCSGEQWGRPGLQWAAKGGRPCRSGPAGVNLLQASAAQSCLCGGDPRRSLQVGSREQGSGRARRSGLTGAILLQVYTSCRPVRCRAGIAAATPGARGRYRVRSAGGLCGRGIRPMQASDAQSRHC